ncbi:Proline synthase co-transcribed bacterial protein [Ananas comosus]|uniref:Proline synthase co-transcribed bacterial protein n=1 Tax=Ananas comosus TaxID=4615 RepID=A0A199VB89_ANACO|nr:Proline synthase co-transcribed bacterial protein [Ananas comosus]
MAAPAAEVAAVSAATALRSVLGRVRAAAEKCGRRAEEVRVVAVGKTKPASLIRQLYDAGHRCFGENYVQEIVDKAPQLPVDIEWHYIGHLQSNKVKSLLASVPNLDMVESVDNEKTLSNCRIDVCKALGIPTEQCELSMGMSGDFEQAIEMGSTNVRIGSTIFGPREYPNRKQSQ